MALSSNPGPATATTGNSTSSGSTSNPGTYTQLVNGTSYGQMNYTTDAGLVIWDGTRWLAINTSLVK